MSPATIEFAGPLHRTTWNPDSAKTTTYGAECKISCNAFTKSGNFSSEFCRMIGYSGGAGRLVAGRDGDGVLWVHRAPLGWLAVLG